MATRDDIIRAREARSREVLALVAHLGSVKAAAAHLGISRQRVEQLIGPGAHPEVVATSCQDCGRPVRTSRHRPPRCPRCRGHLARTGEPWSPNRVAPKPRPTATHCKRGHPLAGANLYVSPKGQRHCRACARDRGRQYRAEERARRSSPARDVIRARMRPAPPRLEVIAPAGDPTDDA